MHWPTCRHASDRRATHVSDAVASHPRVGGANAKANACRQHAQSRRAVESLRSKERLRRARSRREERRFDKWYPVEATESHRWSVHVQCQRPPARDAVDAQVRCWTRSPEWFGQSVLLRSFGLLEAQGHTKRPQSKGSFSKCGLVCEDVGAAHCVTFHGSRPFHEQVSVAIERDG